MSQASPLTPARRRAQELAASGDLAGARAMLEKAVDLGRANLGDDDPDVLQTSLQLGQLLQRLDDQPAARRVLEEAYAAGQWRLGDHDPLMVEISHDIGLVAEELGNRHEARKAFTRVAEHGPAALGANHPAVARAQAYLGLDPDNVRATTSTTAPAAQPYSSGGTPLTLITPVPAEDPFPEPPARAYTVEPPPPPSAQTVWTPPEPRRSTESIDEPTVVHPIVTPRPAQPATQPDAPAFDRPESAAPPTVQFSPADRASSPTVEFGQTDRASMPTAEFGQPDRASMPTVEFGRPASAAPQFQAPPARPDQQWGPPQHSALQPAPRRFPVAADAPTSALQPISAGPTTTLVPANAPTPYRKRGLTLFAAITAALASLIAVVALVFVLANRKSTPPPPAATDVPTLGGTPPGDLKLIDRGSEVDLTWTDPAHGTVPFIVMRARQGEELVAIGNPGPAATSFRDYGLNAKLNYCFAVVAAYRSTKFAASPQRCTNRPAATTTTTKK